MNVHPADPPAVYGWAAALAAMLAAAVVGGAVAYAVARRWGA